MIGHVCVMEVDGGSVFYVVHHCFRTKQLELIMTTFTDTFLAVFTAQMMIWVAQEIIKHYIQPHGDKIRARIEANVKRANEIFKHK